MAANVETMFSVREKPWHGLGTVVAEAPGSKEALRLAGLDWEVSQHPIFTRHGEIGGYKANVKEHGRPGLRGCHGPLQGRAECGSVFIHR